MPIFAPVERPPELFLLESAVVVEVEDVAVAVAAAEAAVKSAAVVGVAVPPPKEPVASDLELISSNTIISFLVRT
jgi:hypothetical protein